MGLAAIGELSVAFRRRRDLGQKMASFLGPHFVRHRLTFEIDSSKTTLFEESNSSAYHYLKDCALFLVRRRLTKEITTLCDP